MFLVPLALIAGEVPMRIKGMGITRQEEHAPRSICLGKRLSLGCPGLGLRGLAESIFVAGAAFRRLCGLVAFEENRRNLVLL
jgi:hypothetical protein